MALGNVFLLLRTYVCRSVSCEDGIRRSELYIFICKRGKKPRIKSHLPQRIAARGRPRPMTRSRRLTSTDARVTMFLQHPQNAQIVPPSVKR